MIVFSRKEEEMKRIDYDNFRIIYPGFGNNPIASIFVAKPNYNKKECCPPEKEYYQGSLVGCNTCGLRWRLGTSSIGIPWSKPAQWRRTFLSWLRSW